MLLFALAVLATQEVAIPMPDPGAASPVRTQRSQSRPDGSIVNLADDRCASLLRRVSPGSVIEPLGRSGPERVRMYHLLDRRIDGCQAPLVVSHDLPQANAARGRNLADGWIHPR